MNIRRINRGFTLIEILIAMALFIMMAAAGSYAIMHGIKAQQFDHRVREAQAATRNGLDRLADEMRSACCLPSGNELAYTSSVSGVLFPDPYDKRQSMGAGYNVYTETINNEKVIYSLDRTIFTRLVNPNAGGDVNNFVYVEWMVPSSNSGAAAGKSNSLIRNVYRMGTLYNGKGHEFNKSESACYIKPSYFITSNLVDKDSTSVVAKLPGEKDTFRLKISRPKKKDNPNKSLAVYDCNLLFISLKAEIKHPEINDKTATIDLSTQVRLQVDDNYY